MRARLFGYSLHQLCVYFRRFPSDTTLIRLSVSKPLGVELDISTQNSRPFVVDIRDVSPRYMIVECDVDKKC